MNRKLSRILPLAAAILLVAGCVNDTRPSREEPLSIQQLEVRAKARPEGVSDKDVAWFLSAGLPRFPSDVSLPHKQSDKDVGVLLWQGPMLVSVEDGDGNDLDLNTYPGNVIHSYLASLADYTNLAITTTQASRHDNNVSIVVSESKAVGGAGTIYGVPELFDRPHRNLSEVLQSSYIPRYDDGGEEQDANGVFMLGYGARACGEHLVIPRGSSIDPAYVWGRMDSLFHMCLGPAGIFFFLGETGEPRVMFEEQKHPFYFWRVLYNSRLRPGMKPSEAKKRLVKYLSASKHPE